MSNQKLVKAAPTERLTSRWPRSLSPGRLLVRVAHLGAPVWSKSEGKLAPGSTYAHFKLASKYFVEADWESGESFSR